MLQIAQLVLIASNMGVDVVWDRTLPTPAAYHHAERTIWLRDGRPDAPTRCSLAHELGHAHYDHAPGGDYLAQERQADMYAAQVLVSEHEYAAAERLVGHHVGAIARELDVSIRVVESFRALLEAQRSA